MSVTVVIGTALACLAGLLLVRMISRGLDRYARLRRVDHFDGGCKELYEQAEQEVIEQRSPSAWEN